MVNNVAEDWEGGSEDGRGEEDWGSHSSGTDPISNNVENYSI